MTFYIAMHMPPDCMHSPVAVAPRTVLCLDLCIGIQVLFTLEESLTVIGYVCRETNRKLIQPDGFVSHRQLFAERGTQCQRRTLSLAPCVYQVNDLPLPSHISCFYDGTMFCGPLCFHSIPFLPRDCIGRIFDL